MSNAHTTRWFEIGGIASLLILLIFFVSFTAVSAQPLPDGPSGSDVSTGLSDSSRMLEKAQREGSVRAIVGLRTDFTPEGRLSQSQADDQRGAIESAGAGLRTELAGTGYRTLREYETVPYIALRLTPEAFRAVQDSPTTTTIQEDVAVPPDLAESSTIVQAPAMWETNLTGAGGTIAVLDTGVDRFHPFLGGRVVEEACFSSSSSCPNGNKTQTGMDSGAPCTYAAKGCRHGTHVAGIAAGQGSDFSGVAPNVNIMSVQVFSRATGSACENAQENPCPGTFPSDQIKGLERVYQLRNTYDFAAVNMSFGGGRHTSYCDSDSRKAIIDNLKAAGIATVIASGNDGFTDAVNAPACISSAITVGNTTKRDALASNSNMDRGVDLLAPGSDINSSVPGGGFASLSGTSMAAPHVAGAWALLEERDPLKDVTRNMLDLQAKGTPVQDTRAGGTVIGNRINIADAAGVRLFNDNFVHPETLFGVTNSINGVNVAARREAFEPDHLPLSGSLGENSVWYRWTAPVSGPATVDTCTSSFDTALAAYTGSDLVDGLSQVASNDDACNVPNHRGSKIAFDAVAGTNYQIAVAGVEGGLAASEGTFTLNVAYDLPPNDNFANAQTLSGNSVNGTTVGATRETGEPDHYTTNPNDGHNFIGEHTVWYSWTAPFAGQVEMNTCEDGPISSVLAVYTGSDLSTLNRVTDDRNGCLSGLGSRVTFDATAGTTYRIAVGNPDELSQGNTFTLEVIDKKPPSVTSTSPANNATGIARGANVGATFSKAMEASTIKVDTFKLRKQGTTTSVRASVTYDPATNAATLNPNTNLTAGATYIATVTTGAQDLAGNSLDQNPSTAGNQSMSWQFKVKP